MDSRTNSLVGFTGSLLLLSGCAWTSLEDLYIQLEDCVIAKLDCNELESQVEKRERFVQMKKNAEMNCQPNSIGYCDDRMYGCGRRRLPRPKEYVCIRL